MKRKGPLKRGRKRRKLSARITLAHNQTRPGCARALTFSSSILAPVKATEKNKLLKSHVNGGQRARPAVGGQAQHRLLHMCTTHVQSVLFMHARRCCQLIDNE